MPKIDDMWCRAGQRIIRVYNYFKFYVFEKKDTVLFGPKLIEFNDRSTLVKKAQVLSSAHQKMKNAKKEVAKKMQATDLDRLMNRERTKLSLIHI